MRKVETQWSYAWQCETDSREGCRRLAICLLTFSPSSHAFTWQRTDKCSEKSLVMPENDPVIKYIIH